MLSEMVASLFALAANPDIPAFIDEEMPITQSFVRVGVGRGELATRRQTWRLRLNIVLTPGREIPGIARDQVVGRASAPSARSTRRASRATVGCSSSVIARQSGAAPPK